MDKDRNYLYRAADNTKYLLLRILMWIGIAVAAVLIFARLGIRNIPGYSLDGDITTELTRLDGSTEHYDSNAFSFPKRGEKLVFTVRIPEEASSIRYPVLCFSSYNSVITVRVDGKTVYEHEPAMKFKGYPTGHVVTRLPLDNRFPQVLTIEFLQQEDNTLSNFRDVVLLPAEYSWLYPVRTVEFQTSLTLFIIFAVVSVMVFIFNAVFRPGIQEAVQGFMLSLFCLSVTCWAMGYTGTLFVLTNDDVIIPYWEYVFTYLIPVFFTGYMLTGTASYGWRKTACLVLEVFFISVFTVATLLQLFSAEHNGYLALLYLCYAGFLSGGIFYIILVFRDRTSAGWFIRAGLVITLALAMVEVAAAVLGRIRTEHTGRLFTTQNVTPAIVLVFQTSLLADYISRSFRDYRQRQELARLEMVAYSDALTGLESRASFEEKESARLEEVGEYAIAFIDTDGLKSMNDHYGHKEGDNLLRAVSAAIQKGCAGTDCRSYRYGGDEFLITGPDEETVSKAVSVMKEELNRHPLAGNLSATVSAGIAVHPAASKHSVADVIREADSRMYVQKQESRRRREDLSSAGPA